MTPYSVRGRKRKLIGRGGHSSAKDADRGAMAGGGRGRVDYARHEDMDTTGSRKRKRGQNTSDIEDEQKSLDEPNGNEDGISDEHFPKLGMDSEFSVVANVM